MKALETLIRVNSWTLDEKRRQLADLEDLRAGFYREIAHFEKQLILNQAAAASSPEIAQTYGHYAVTVIERRRVLRQSIEEAQEAVDAATDEVHHAYQEVKKYETALEREKLRQRKEEDRVAQIELDEMGLNMFRRNNPQN
jgi:flagellar protein FliJ